MRMSGFARREQLVAVGRKTFASKGFDGTSVEEIASQAKISKPVIYEHFGGKYALTADIVDREVHALISPHEPPLYTKTRPRMILEDSALALLSYIESNSDGFRILVRDAPQNSTSGSFSSLMGDIAIKVEHLLANQFSQANMSPKWAPLYAQMLVGLIAQVGQWWLDERRMSKEDVASHVVNLVWNGMRNLRPSPVLLTSADEAK